MSSYSRLFWFEMLKTIINPLDLKTISQFALLEYKHGEPERGKTLFEGILDSHPKRWDMWSIYMDMEANQKNIQGLRYVWLPVTSFQELNTVNRNLFGRIFALKMTSHKAKSVYLDIF